MKKRLFSILLAACLVFGLLPTVAQPAMAAANGTGITGSGTEGSPYIITSADQLAYVAQQVNANGKINGGTIDAAAAYYKLGNNISLSAYSNWTPIGWGAAFKGKFDGAGHSISNLKINATSTVDGQYYGLFGNNQSGTIINVSLIDFNITVTNNAGELRVGGLVGYNDGTILNCSVTGALAGAINTNSYIYTYWGGLVGENYWGTLKNCYSAISFAVTGGDSSPGNPFMGGVAGRNSAGAAQYNYWLFTDAMKIGVDRMMEDLSPSAGFEGTDALKFPVTRGETTTSSLCEALNAGLGILARTDLHTWISSGSYPVYGSLWAPPAYTATVTVKKDGSAFGAGAPTITLGTTVSNAVANGTPVTNGTYNIYANGIYTGVNITVSGSAASVDLNYYTVTFKSQDGNTPLNTQTVLSGQTAVYGGSTPTKTATAQYTFIFSNWVTAANGSSPATLNNITAAKTVYASFTQTLQSYTIIWKKDTTTTIGASTVAYGEMPTQSVPTNTGYTFSGWTPAITSVTGAATYTATWTLDTYAINYTPNGGTASPANPTSYTVVSAAITLNKPARDGYKFVGWSGTELTGGENLTVTIPTGSTGNKTYTANWKANAPSTPPASSIVTAKTDTSITINTQTGYDYSIDGTNWVSGTGSSDTFIGLSSDTPYNLVYRVAAVSTGYISAASDASAGLTVTTKAASASVSVPDAPTIGTDADKPTSTSITVSMEEGNEYYISTSATPPTTWSTGDAAYATGTGMHTFTGLTPATQYYIHVRVAETETAMPSASNYATQYTLPVTPSASVVTVNYAEEKINFANTYEVSSDQNFLDNSKAVVSGGTIQPETTYYVRVKATGGAPASEALSFTVATRPTAPDAITADKTKNSITITPVAGQEYKIDGGTWQDSGSFTGLSASTGYTVYARVKAVNSGSGSFASEAYSVTIKTKSDGSSGFVLPTISVTPTYAPGKTLYDIPLPTNWAWSAPETVPAVTNSGYSVVYTPADTATVDYSSVEGYVVDGSGKVTITRTIPLTVNRATPTAADYTFTASASLDYSGTAKTAAVAVKGGVSGMGAVTVRYYPGATETAPTDAGTYTVKIDLAQGDNYTAATDITDSAWTFTIAKIAQTPLSITGNPASITYGDTFTLAATGGSGTGALTWAVTSGSSAAVDADTGAVTITGVGETTITATKAADGNHTEAVTDTYTFTPAQRLITVDTPTAVGGWTKIYDGKADFDKAMITIGGITNKVGSDDVIVSVQSAAYNTADMGSNKPLTITYAMEGADSGKYATPADTVIDTAFVTAAAPGIALKSKTVVYSGKTVEIDTAAVRGAADGIEPDGAVTYTYYTKDTCTDADRTSVDQSGAEAVGGAPKAAGTYYVKATIAAGGNYTAATSAAVTLTIYYPSSGGANAFTPVIVDGKTVNIGTEKKSGDATTVTVDQAKLGANIVGAASGSSVLVPVSGSGAATASLVVKNIEDMAQKGMTLTVQTGGVAYNLNAAAIDTVALATAFPGVDMSTVPFDVTISNSSVGVTGETLVLSPVVFTVAATHNGKTVSVDTFSAYMDRVIEVTKEQAAKITTAVVVNADGSVRHVPTSVIEKGGKYYAVINSRTNSTYALIQNERTFADAKGKWYEAAVNEMGSRKIIAGRSAAVFDGEAGITRAEFAAILVRALGLPADGASTFADVPAGAWYAGAVAAAVQYGLAEGRGSGRFDPSAAITRQEAMLMLQRAAALTGFAGASGNLDSFADANSVGAWAQGAAKWSVGSGLIQGSGGKLSPTANITRAECATVILRLLQTAGLVDVRSHVGFLHAKG